MRFTALDGWRGVCAICVAVSHSYVVAHVTRTPVIRDAYLFVDFFFVLSGFVIAHAYGRTLSDGRSAAGFALRRFGRLYPLHLFVLILFVIVECAKLYAARSGATMAFPPFSEQKSPFSLLTNLALAHGLGMHSGATWNYPSWSISAEFYTYLIFAGAMLITTRWNRRNRLALFAAISLAAAAAVMTVSQHGMEVIADYGFLRAIYGFFAGVLAQAAFGGLKPHLVRLSGMTASVLEFAAVALMFGFIGGAGQNPVSFAAPVVFVVVTVLFAAERGLISRLLMTPFFRSLGDLSYSIYMIHIFVMINVFSRLIYIVDHVTHMSLTTPGTEEAAGVTMIDLKSLFAGDALILVYICTVIFVAGFSYRFVETPLRRYFNRVADGVSSRTSVNAEAIGADARVPAE